MAACKMNMNCIQIETNDCLGDERVSIVSQEHFQKVKVKHFVDYSVIFKQILFLCNKS